MNMTRTRLKTLLAAALLVTALGCTQFIKEFKEAIQTMKDRELIAPEDKDRERSPQKVVKKLENGLSVVIEESFGAPVVAVQVWVNVGSADETDQQAGIAHLIEHMMFKGTKKRAVGQTALEVESLGGDLNAYTSYDQTVYHITIASRFYGRALEILADQVLAPTFDAGELAREKEVVLEEIRRSKDNPRSRIYKYLFAEAYEVHTYRRPVIGYVETVSGFTRDDILKFYNDFYGLANMTVVIIGDVDAKKAMKEVEKQFAGVGYREPPAEDARPRASREPVQAKSRAKVYREEVSEGYLNLGFHIPEFKADDIAVLDVLSLILSGGESSRLPYRIRTERRLVNNIYAYAYTPRDPGMFMVGSDLTEDKAGQALEMILKQLYLIKHEAVEDWELEMAKLTLETEGIYAKETVDGQARRLGFFYTYTGDPEFERVYLEKIRKVTAHDIQQAAKKYFTATNLSIVAILPPAGRKSKGSGLDASAINKIVQEVEKWDRSYQPGELTEPDPISPPEVPKREPVPALDQGESSASPPVKYVLKNGIRLIVKENHAVPLVSVNAAFEGGLRHENPENNGINNFIAETITEGTAHYPASTLHSMIEARAGRISGFSGRNSIGVRLEVPSPYFRSCLPVFGEVIRYPMFPEVEVETNRGIIISNIRSQDDRPSSLAFRRFRAELFREHPYGMDPLGSEASIERMTREDLLNYYQGFAMPTNLVIAVVGDVEAEEVRREMEELFQDWAGRPYAPESAANESAPESPREVMECKEVNQANIVIGFLGTTVTSDDRHSLQVLSSALSGMSGRLFIRLRGKQSLAYSVFAMSEPGLDPGYFAVYIGTAAEKEQTSRKGILEELKKIRSETISKDELKRAQEVLIGDYEIQLQRFSNQAMHYALDELYGLGFRSSERYAEKIQAVTIEDVREMAKKYIKVDAPVISIVKPCEGEARLETEPAGSIASIIFGSEGPDR